MSAVTSISKLQKYFFLDDLNLLYVKITADYLSASIPLDAERMTYRQEATIPDQPARRQEATPQSAIRSVLSPTHFNLSMPINSGGL